VRETDLVKENTTTELVLGRPPILLTLNEQAGFAAGVKLRSDGMTIAITDLGGTSVHHVDHPLQERAPEGVLRRVASEVHAALEQAHLDSTHVLGLGIGMPGLIDHINGVCRYSSRLGWREVDVRHELARHLDMPVYVDNDVNMLTAAEIAHGAGREVKDFLTISIGAGIGLGIVSRGEIYRGAFGGAGEFGHTKTEFQLRCECGAVGCLEAVASEPGIQEQVRRRKPRSVTSIQDVIDLALHGDAEVQAILANAGRVLGRSIGNLLNLFNPELVIVTGEGVRMGAFLLDPMRQAVRTAAFDLLGQDTRLEVQQWGDESWAEGAAGIVVHEMLRPPIYETAGAGPLIRLLGRVRSGQKHRSAMLEG
jgi:predicted NBD/HSP70 family sugar kinase